AVSCGVDGAAGRVDRECADAAGGLSVGLPALAPVAASENPALGAREEHLRVVRIDCKGVDAPVEPVLQPGIRSLPDGAPVAALYYPTGAAGRVDVVGIARVDRESDDRILLRVRQVGWPRDPMPAAAAVAASEDVAPLRSGEQGARVMRIDRKRLHGPGDARDPLPRRAALGRLLEGADAAGPAAVEI